MAERWVVYCIRLRPERKDHVWSYDFVAARTADGRAFRILAIVDEYTRECLAMVVKRSITSQDVLTSSTCCPWSEGCRSTSARTTAQSTPPKR